MNKQILRSTIFIGLFAIPFIPFFVSSFFFFPFITTKAFTWRIIVEIIFAAWFLLALLDQEYRPKKSPLLYLIVAFIALTGLSDFFGVDPMRSFWSNFERMEGFITMLHLGAFFLVIGSVFNQDHWKRWWNTTLMASAIMVVYGLFQLLGVAAIHQGGVRVDGTLGNAIYLAVYMLFHIFLAGLCLWRERRNTTLKWVYSLLILSQIFILYYTATRGAILGLLGGVLVAALLNVRNNEDQAFRKVSQALLLGMVILVLGFFAVKNSSFVTKSQVLSRFSSLTVEEIKTQGRYFIWPMAIKGAKDHPILGWGQENFSYIFQKYYDPNMYNLEPWFDRAHNTYLDWLVAGGLLGLLCYLSLYVALLYLIWCKGENLSYAEKSILTGLVAAYAFHNFFVFDHLISYILFFSLLAYVYHLKSGESLWQRSISERSVKRVALPSVSIVLLLSLYFINWRPMLGNLYLIDALKDVQTPGQMKAATLSFEKAYHEASWGKQEVVEHLSNSVANILTSNDLTIEEKNNFFIFTRQAVLDQVAKRPNDARMELMTGSFFSLVGQYDDALKHLNHAQELMPNKQQIRFEIGSVYVGEKKLEEALAVFKEAYELAPSYDEAKIIYLVGAIYAGDRTVESNMISQLKEKQVIFDDRIVNAYYANSRLDRVRALINDRIRLDPSNTTHYQELLKSIK